MQDVAMILGLPLEGNAVIGMIQTDGWRDMVEAHIGIRPPEPPEGVKDRKTSGVSSAWLNQNFNHCPQGAPQEAVERKCSHVVVAPVRGLPVSRWFWKHHLMDGPSNSGTAMTRT